MQFFDVLTQPHQAILLTLWVGLLFGYAYPTFVRTRPDETTRPSSPSWHGIIWLILVLVTFVAWLRGML